MIDVLFRITTALLVWCYLIHGKETVDHEITECCVGEALDYSEQTLTCSGVLVLSITNVTFWCKQKCNHNRCDDKTCCKHCKRQYCSCFSSYNLTLLSNIQRICNENRILANLVSTEWENECFYITIKYECDISTSSSAPSETISHPTGSTSSTPSETTSHPADSHTTGSTSSTPSEATSHTSGSTSSEERQASTTQTSNANSSASTSNNPSSSVTITPNLSTQNHDLTSQPNDPMPNQISTHDQDVGGIVGGIVGVIVVGVIVGVCVFRIKRRQRIDPISPNNVHIESTVDTEVTTTLPASISPVYFELESYNNTSSTTTQLTSSDNYDVIVAKPSRRNDNYDHIGVDVLTTDGDYNYLKGINSDKTTAAPDCNYNHVGLFTTEEDNYHHLGGKQSHFISEDTYSLESDDYHHIGESHGHSDTGLDGGDYNYIGCGQELPSMVDIIHYSVEDYSAIPDADAKGSGDISPFPDADTAGGIYSLAKRI